MSLTASAGLSDADFKALIVRVKEANRGPDVAADLGLVLKRDRAFCPECQAGGGKTPDLVVKDAGFHCWKCGLKGDVIRLVEVISGKSTADAIAYLAGRAGIAWDRGAIRGGYQGSQSSKIARPGQTSAVADRPSAPAKAETPPSIDPATRSSLYVAFLSTVSRRLDGTPGAAYLEARGISPGTAAALGVRFVDDLAPMWKLSDRDTIKASGLSSFYGWQLAKVPFIVFPYIRAGAVVYLKGRCLLAKSDADARGIDRFRNTGGTVPCLFNHDAIAGARRVLIAEGEVDALTAIEAGKVAVGLPGWSAWKDEWTADFRGKDVVLVLDADNAGQKGTWDVAKRFLAAGQPTPRQIVLPSGEDLNSYWTGIMNGRIQE